LEAADLTDEIESLILKHELLSAEFGKEMARLLSRKSRMTPEVAARVNLKLAKTVFSKWSIEILTILYSTRSASYGDLKRGLKGVSSRVLRRSSRSWKGAAWSEGR